MLAVVDEAHCIGCTLCIDACPVDAIAGAANRMHTVLDDLCTGCDLCVAPCSRGLYRDGAGRPRLDHGRRPSPRASATTAARAGCGKPPTPDPTRPPVMPRRMASRAGRHRWPMLSPARSAAPRRTIPPQRTRRTRPRPASARLSKTHWRGPVRGVAARGRDRQARMRARGRIARPQEADAQPGAEDKHKKKGITPTMNAAKRREIFARLQAANPTPTTELEYATPFQLLIAVLLSAQATDKSVNIATRKFFPPLRYAAGTAGRWAKPG